MKPIPVIRYAILCTTCLTLAGPVLAQTDQAPDASLEEGVLEEVVVTGSRLRRDSYNVSTPLVQMEQELSLIHISEPTRPSP